MPTIAAYAFWLLLVAISATVPLWLISLWFAFMPADFVNFGFMGAVWGGFAFAVIFFTAAAIIFEPYGPGEGRFDMEPHLAPVRWMRARAKGQRARPLLVALAIFLLDGAALAGFAWVGPVARFEAHRAAERAEAARLAEMARWPEERRAMAERALAAAGRCEAGEPAPLERFEPGIYIPHFDYEAGAERQSYMYVHPGMEAGREEPGGFTLVPGEIGTIVHVIERRTEFQHRYSSQKYVSAVGSAYRTILLVCLTDREGRLFHRLTFTGIPPDTARFTSPGFAVYADYRMEHLPAWIAETMGLRSPNPERPENYFEKWLLVSEGWPEPDADQ